MGAEGTRPRCQEQALYTRRFLPAGRQNRNRRPEPVAAGRGSRALSSGAVLDPPLGLECDLMMRRVIGGIGLAVWVTVAAGCGVSARGAGLSPEFTAAGRDAHRFMEVHLIPEIRNARFARVLTESRVKVKHLQTLMTSEEERNVWLLLTMINAKANESRHLYELSLRDGVPVSSSVAASQAVDLERRQCMREAGGWLSGEASPLAALTVGPCLVETKQAAALLGREAAN